MKKQNKKTSISVNKADLDIACVQQFNFMAKAFEISRGKLLSRALYLAAVELTCEIATNGDIESGHRNALLEGKTVDKDILLNKKDWLDTVKYTHS